MLVVGLLLFSHGKYVETKTLRDTRQRWLFANFSICVTGIYVKQTNIDELQWRIQDRYYKYVFCQSSTMSTLYKGSVSSLGAPLMETVVEVNPKLTLV